jgi:hypothetical protein
MKLYPCSSAAADMAGNIEVKNGLSMSSLLANGTCRPSVIDRPVASPSAFAFGA